jgi:hypothetical protein
MIVASFSQYLPVKDLLEILAVCVVVAVVAPSAVAVGIVGLGRRERAAETHESGALGTALIVGAVAVLAALIGLGIYALFQH